LRYRPFLEPVSLSSRSSGVLEYWLPCPFTIFFEITPPFFAELWDYPMSAEEASRLVDKAIAKRSSSLLKKPWLWLI
jgi:hypothetical protein